MKITFNHLFNDIPPHEPPLKKSSSPILRIRIRPIWRRNEKKIWRKSYLAVACGAVSGDVSYY